MHDVIIVGGGPAGCEAAWYCASGGLSVLLLTTSLDSLFWPAGGGARLATDEGSLSAAILERLAPQDRDAPLRARDLHRFAKEALEGVTALHLLQSNVSALLPEAGVISGVSTWEGLTHHGRAVALCAGSFLQGRLSAGQLRETAGRPGEMAYDDLYLDLVQLGFSLEQVAVSAREGDYEYLLESRILAASEFAEAGSFRLKRFGNLFAAGFCAGGWLTFSEAARQGMQLGRELSASVGKA